MTTAAASFVSASPVLLFLIDHLDLRTLLNFRRCCRSVFQLIATYESSIACRLFKELFPYEDATCQQPIANPAGSLHALDQYYLARRLAGLLLSSHRQYWGPEEALGSSEHVDYKDVQRLSRGCLLWENLLPDFCQQRIPNNILTQDEFLRGIPEAETLRRWQAHIAPLSADDRFNLAFFEHRLRSLIHADAETSSDIGTDRLWRDVRADDRSEAVDWLYGFMLCQGPKLTLDLCSNILASTRAEDRLRAQIRKRYVTDVGIECSIYRTLLRDARRRFRMESLFYRQF